MDVFSLRDQSVTDHRHYVESFGAIRDERIVAHIDQEFERGLLWPDPRLHIIPSFASGGPIDACVADGTLHRGCPRIFRVGKEDGSTSDSHPLTRHTHHDEAIRVAGERAKLHADHRTGSGRLLSYIVPIVDDVLRSKAKERSH